MTGNEQNAPNQAPDGSVNQAVTIEVAPTITGPDAPTVETNGSDKLLAGKFKTQEELVAAYLALQQPPEADKADADQANQKPEIPPGDRVLEVEVTDEASGLLKEKGLNVGEFVHELHSAGQLSDASYEKLAKAGLDKGVVDEYLTGQRVLAEREIASVQESVGGAERFQAITQWAGAGGLSASEIAAYMRVVETNDVEAIRIAALGVAAKYEQATGRDPARVLSGKAGSPNADNQGYSNWAQVQKDMSDSRYQTDAEYRAKVSARLNNSPNL